jgi:hypothetical protein
MKHSGFPQLQSQQLSDFRLGGAQTSLADRLGVEVFF